MVGDTASRRFRVGVHNLSISSCFGKVEKDATKSDGMISRRAVCRLPISSVPVGPFLHTRNLQIPTGLHKLKDHLVSKILGLPLNSILFHLSALFAVFFSAAFWGKNSQIFQFWPRQRNENKGPKTKEIYDAITMAATKNRIILGLMTMGPDPAHGARITSLDEFKKILDYFQQIGYDEVDTARLYCGGKQEEFTAAAGWKERGLKMATKWYPYFPGAFKAAKLREMMEKSLQELKTDSVDIFYLHAADRTVPVTETLEEMDALHKEGKFSTFGLSNFSAYEIAEIWTICNERGWVKPTLYQGLYNCICRCC